MSILEILRGRIVTNDLIKFRFDGVNVDNHSIDVNDLIPSLKALSDLCQSVNKQVNGSKALMKVSVRADIE